MSARQVPLEGDAALAAFASEDDPIPPPAAQPQAPSSGSAGTRRRAARASLWVALVAVSGTAAAAGTWQYSRRQPAATAFLSVETSTPGADVVVDGKPAGRTPVGLWLAPGSYAVRVGSAPQLREATVQLAAGASVFRHFDLGSPIVATTGVSEAPRQHLRIETDPGAMSVMVDGVDRGKSPVTVQGLTPGMHEIAIRGAGSVMRHKIAVRAGESAVVVFTSGAKTETAAAPALAAGGWLALSSAVPVQVRESGKVVGNTDSERIMLPTGEHALEFVNEALGYQSRRSIRIEAGKTTTVQLERVNGLLNINAQPWAEVWVDGERIGETPIGNLSRPIGVHEVVLRHPQLGERRERVTITARQPARLGVDLRGGKK